MKKTIHFKLSIFALAACYFFGTGFFYVRAETPDTTPPTVSITAPANGVTVSNAITFSADATDDSGSVSRVEFYYNSTLISSSTGPFSISWDTRLVPNGAYALTAKAFDGAGNSSTSGVVNVTTNNTPDTTAPVLYSFVMPASASSLTVAVTEFFMESDYGVNGYMITESATAPTAGAAGWQSSVPTSFIFAGEGTRTAYAWARDGWGNVSTSRSAAVTINIPDVTKPTVDTFTLPATSSYLSVDVSAFAATDNKAVTGYMLTESATAPAAGAAGWSVNAPQSFTFTTSGSKTLYAWAKDAAGNVSLSRNASVTVNSINSALFESTAKNFSGISSPSYGKIGWNSGVSGVWQGSALATYGTGSGYIVYTKSVAYDAAGNIYVADGDLDMNLSRIQKRSSSGTWTTLASFGTSVGSVYDPTAVVADADGNIYVADSYRVQKRSIDGTWTQLAGNGYAVGSVVYPQALALDADGNLYVGESGDGGDGTYGRIQKRSTDGVWTQLAGYGFSTGSVYNPLGITIDSNGDLYVSDAGNNRIQKRASDGTWSVIASNGTALGSVSTPRGLMISKNNLYVVDNNRIQVRMSNGSWSLIASSGASLGSVSSPIGIAVDDSDNIYVSENLYSAGRVQKLSSGTAIRMRVRTGNSSMSDASVWSDACNVTNGQELSTNSCVQNGDEFVQYQVTLATTAGVATPTLLSVTVETQKNYPTDFISSYLISSPFDTNNPFNKLSSITWNAMQDNGNVGFQVRATDSATKLTDADLANDPLWCGPTTCSTTPGGAGSDFYTNATGPIITGPYSSLDASNSNKNKVFQYATFLKASNGTDTSLQVPVLNEVSVGYSFNQAPAVSALTYRQRLAAEANPGSIDIGYRLTNPNNNIVGTTNAYSLLFYQIDGGIKLSGAMDNAATGNLTFTNTNNSPIPTEGAMLIDSELIEYTNGVNNGNGTSSVSIKATGGSGDAGSGRGAHFGGVNANSYYTTAVTHLANAPIYFQATKNTSGGALLHNSFALTGAAPFADATFNWDPKTETGINLNGLKLSVMNFRVVANDGNSTEFNNISSATDATLSAKTLDLQAPNITDVAVTGFTEKAFKLGDNIPVKFTFTADDTISISGVKATIGQGTSTRTCMIGTDGTCNFQVLASDDWASPISVLDFSQSDPGSYLKDQFGNTTALSGDSVYSVPDNMNIDDKGIISFDGTVPNIINVGVDNEIISPNKSTGIKDSTSISYTIEETSGTSTVNVEIYDGETLIRTLTDDEVKNSGINSVPWDGKDNSSNFVADKVYTYKINATDKSGNIGTEKTGTIMVDNTLPSVSAPIVPASLTNDVTPNITWAAATDTGSGTASYELQRKLTSADDSTFAVVPGAEAVIVTNYTETGLTDETYTYRIVALDNAGNESEVSSNSDSMEIDTTPAVLTNFTTTNSERFIDGVAPNEAYGTNAVINITANFNEPVAAGSTLTVVLENGANPAVEVPLSDISGSTVSGSFTVQGPRKGYDTANQTIRNIKNINVIDLADNAQLDENAIPADKTLGKNIAIDTGTPVLLRFEAVKSGTSISSGNFKTGDQLTITANYSKTLTTGNLTVRMNTENGNEDLEDIDLSLEGGIPSTKLIGTYSVIDGDNVNILKIFSIVSQNAIDQKGNPLVTSEKISIDDYDTANALMEPPIDAVINISGMQIDTISPVATIASETDNVDQGPVQSDSVKIHIEETNPVAYKYIFSSDIDCANKSYDAGIVFTSDETLTFDTQDNNGKYICAQIDDLSGNKVYWVSSRTLNIDRLKPTGTIKVDSSKNPEIELNAADWERSVDGLQMQVVVNEDVSANCDFTDAQWEPYAGSKDLNDVNSDIKVCIQYKDLAGNVSDLITATTPETPMNVKISDTSNLSATPVIRRGLISWQVPSQLGSGWKNAEVDSCNVLESEADCDPSAPLASPSSIIMNQQDNFYVHSNLEAGKKYCYRVKFSDTNDDVSLYSDRKCFIPGADLTGVDNVSPVVANVLPSNGNYIKDGHVDFTLSEALQPGAKIVFTSATAINSEVIDATHEYTLIDLELTTTDPQTKTVAGLVDGNTYKLKFTGSDLAGNPINFTEVTNIHFDNTPPTVSDVSPTNDAVINDGTVTFTLSEPLHEGAKIIFTDSVSSAQHEYVLSGPELVTMTPQTKSVQGLVSGNIYSLRFEGSDPAWNFMNFTEITGINFDSNAPTISESLSVSANEFSPNGDAVKESVDFSFKANKAGTYEIAISGNGKTATLSGSMDADTAKSHTWNGKNELAEVFSDGNVSATLTITDAAGNSTTGNPISFKVDTTAPTGTFSINSNAQITISPNVTLNSGISDAGSGLSLMSFSDDDTNWSELEAYNVVKNWTLPGEDGDKTVYARYEDKAGNKYLQNDTISLNTNSLSISFVGADGDVNPALNNSDHISIKIDGINIANATYGYTSGACDGTVDGELTNQITGTATSRTKIFDVTDQNVNGKFLCVRADDGGSTVEYKQSANAFNIDSTKPLISFTDDVEGNLARSEDVIIHAEDANLSATTYAFTSSACDANQDFANIFVSDQLLTIDSEHADQFICARAVDSAGNVEYAKSANTLNIDATAPTGTVSVDRSSTEGQVLVNMKPVDLSGLVGMKADVQMLDSDSVCNFTGSLEIDITGETTTATFGDSASSIKKACVRFTDRFGNLSGSLAALSPETPQSLAVRDISNLTATPQFRGSMLSWQAPIVAGSGTFKNSQVSSCNVARDQADCIPAELIATITDQAHTYFVSEDLEDAKYCYRVKFEDSMENRSAYSQTKCFIPGEAPIVETQGLIQDVSIDNITKTQARITFRTVENTAGNPALATRAYVEAYSDSALTIKKASTNIESSYSVDHIINLTVPTSPDPYYLKIIAVDSSADTNPNKTTTLAYDQQTNPTLTFTTLGVLSKINIDLTKEPRVVSDSAAVVEFTTDQKASCFIENGTTSGTYGGIPTMPDASALSHAIHIESLLSETKYYFKVTCRGDDNTSISSAEGSFQTLELGLVGDADNKAPEISNISLTGVTGENATIVWNTNEAANSLVAYEVEGATFSMMSGDSKINSDRNNFSSAHAVSISGLMPATKYFFTVMSYDKFGNIALSVQNSFTTKEPSSLSSIKVISKSLGQATITWETGEATTSAVEYGLTTSYGQKKEDSSKTKEHEVTLSDLTPGETYHFRVKGEDENKNIFASSDITFQPKAPPKISDFKIDSITEHEAIITFNTNVSTDAIVTYVNTDKEEDTGFQGRPDFVSKHEIKLKDLTSGAKFSIKLKVRDEEGNETEETFPNFTTTKDEKPPVIERVKTDSALTQNDKVQAIISWSTDEMSTGTLIYREGKAGEEKKFEVNSAEAFSHVGVITSFKPGVVYYFNVRSADAAGNTAKSTDYALLTPKKRQNIIQIIIGNFTDIFGWAKF